MASSTQRDPIARFRAIFERAKRKDPGDPTRVALATADAAGQPSVRMVLLKGVDERGFVFFTNYGSRKARELEANPHAALCFYWGCIREQVRVEGTVERISAKESDEYFETRGRGSQLAAVASMQSEPLPSRIRLVSEYLKLRALHAGRPIPRPDFWGGYVLEPKRIEFWSNKAHRLHERREYLRDGDGWQMRWLYP